MSRQVLQNTARVIKNASGIIKRGRGYQKNASGVTKGGKGYQKTRQLLQLAAIITKRRSTTTSTLSYSSWDRDIISLFVVNDLLKKNQSTFYVIYVVTTKFPTPLLTCPFSYMHYSLRRFLFISLNFINHIHVSMIPFSITSPFMSEREAQIMDTHGALHLLTLLPSLTLGISPHTRFGSSPKC